MICQEVNELLPEPTLAHMLELTTEEIVRNLQAHQTLKWKLPMPFKERQFTYSHSGLLDSEGRGFLSLQLSFNCVIIVFILWE